MSGREKAYEPHLAVYLRFLQQWIRERMYLGVVAAGYDDLSPAHVSMIRYPSLHGLRPTDVAIQMHMSKQAVNDLLAGLEQRGYLTRVPDPTDRRARMIQLTDKGLAMERVAAACSQAAEDELTELVGSKQVENVRQSMRVVIDRLFPERVRPLDAR